MFLYNVLAFQKLGKIRPFSAFCIDQLNKGSFIDDVMGLRVDGVKDLVMKVYKP